MFPQGEYGTSTYVSYLGEIRSGEKVCTECSDMEIAVELSQWFKFR